jgi:hypothetical protein
LDGVTLVDTHDGKLTPGMSILMDKGSIVSITPTAEVSKDPWVMSIDATGRFAIPGFNNMHMHVIDQADSSFVLARMLADGVTGFRQMTGSPELLEERRDGTLPIGKDAPALLVASSRPSMPGPPLGSPTKFATRRLRVPISSRSAWSARKCFSRRSQKGSVLVFRSSVTYKRAWTPRRHH